MLDLTTLARVKSAMQFKTADDDALLQEFIKSASDQIQRFCNRLFEQKERTQFYTLDKGAQSVFVDSIPIVSVVSVFNDFSRNFGNGTGIDPDNFFVKKSSGRIVFDKVTLQHGPGVFKITYTGGLGVNTAAIIAAAPALERAVNMQVAFEFQRKQQVGLRSVSAEGGSITTFDTGGLIKRVREMLRPFRRIIFTHGGGEE